VHGRWGSLGPHPAQHELACALAQLVGGASARAHALAAREGAGIVLEPEEGRLGCGQLEKPLALARKEDYPVEQRAPPRPE